MRRDGGFYGNILRSKARLSIRLCSLDKDLHGRPALGAGRHFRGSLAAWIKSREITVAICRGSLQDLAESTF